MVSKIIDLSSFVGYEGKTITVNEPTVDDMIYITDIMIDDSNGKPNVYKLFRLMINRLAVDAPFKTDMKTLGGIEAKLLLYVGTKISNDLIPLEMRKELI